MKSTTGRTVSGAEIILSGFLRQRRRLIASAVLIAASRAAAALIPLGVGIVVDQTAGDDSLSDFGWTVVGLAALFTCTALSWQWGARLIIYAMADEEHQLRVQIAGHVLNPRSVRTDLSAGDVLTIATSDARRTAVVLEFVLLVTSTLFSVGVSTGILFVVDWRLGLSVLIGVPLMIGGLKLAAPPITRRTIVQQEQAAKTSATATDLINGLRPLSGFGGQLAASGRFSQVSQNALSARLRASKAIAAFNAASEIGTGLLVTALTALATWLAFTKQITVGELITVVGVAQFLIIPLRLAGQLPSIFAQGRGSAERVALVLAAPPLLPEGTEALHSHTGLSLRGIAHRSLRNVNLNAEPGELLGVVALDARDSAALADVLSHQIDPKQIRGDFLLSGQHSVCDVELSALRSTVLAEPHVSDLFSGSLADNVALADDATLRRNERIDSVIQAAAATDVVQAAPSGLGHRIEDRGSNLSGGQRQRIALARALYEDTPILVLHDPTTAVDAVTEHAIAQGLRDFRHAPGSDRTTVLITSSVALLAVTDRVVVIDSGSVVAEGTHEELLGANAAYVAAVHR